MVNPYAINTETGCQPVTLSWPVKHHSSHEGLHTVVGACRYAWEGGRSLIFHDNVGNVQAPLGAAIFLQECDHDPLTNPGRTTLHWLTTMQAQRVLADVFEQGLWELNSNNNDNWWPQEWNDWVL